MVEELPTIGKNMLKDTKVKILGNKKDLGMTMRLRSDRDRW
jgi:hypothetical protein